MPIGNTYVDYTITNASVLTYYFTFPLLDIDHVVVTRNGTTLVQGTNYTVNQSAGSITFLTAITVGDAIRISRVTERDSALVTFVDGATTPASDLNTAFLQNFYISQETDDVGGLSLDKNVDGNYEANNIKIVNVGTATTNGDAANKAYVDQAISDALSYDNSSGYMASWAFTGNGTQTAFSLGVGSSILNDARNYLVTVSGVLQPFSAYSVASNTLTFVAGNAPPNLSSVNVIAIGFARNQIGAAVTSEKWLTPRTFTLSGDATGSVTIDGSENEILPVTLASVGSANPSTLYTNANIQVDTKGRVTSVANGSGAVNFVGATASVAGTAGLVPAPAAGQQGAFIRGDGNWVNPTIYLGIKEWTTPGTYSWTVPTGVYSVRVICVGGAGGSLGCMSPVYPASGNTLLNAASDAALFGGYGAVAEAVFTVTPGTSISVTVGTSGTNDWSFSSAGGAGASSSFGSDLVCGGGTGANAGTGLNGTNGSVSGNAAIADKYITNIPRPQKNGRYTSTIRLEASNLFSTVSSFVADPKYGVPVLDQNSQSTVVSGQMVSTLQGYVCVRW